MIKRISFFALFCVTVYVAIIYDSSSLIFLAGAEFFLPLFLVIVLLLQSRKLTLRLPEEQRYFSHGEEYIQALCIENGSHFPIHRAAVRVSMENHTTGNVTRRWLRQPADTGTTEIRLPAENLEPGFFSVTCEKIRLYDSLCLFYLPMKKKVRRELVQMPEYFPVSVAVKTSESEDIWESGEYEPHKSGSDASHIRELREYRPGDKPNSIHWKLSARQEHLLVKEYGLPIGCSVLFGIDMERLTRSRLELIYSLLHGFAENGGRLLLVWLAPGEHMPRQFPILKAEDAYLAMEALMGSRTVRLRSAQRPEIPTRQLWLHENLELSLNGDRIAVFTEESPREKLQSLELVL